MDIIRQTQNAYDMVFCPGTNIRTKIRVGGNAAATGDKFVPNINMSKWLDEYWINLNFPVAVGGQKESYDGGKVSLDMGEYAFAYYPKNTEDLEYEIVFFKEPETKVVTLNMLCSPGLSFIRQEPFTQQQIDNGASMPENVVGSYAVYCGKGFNKYQTGKFCHIYYPYLRDADGKMARAENFWIDAGTLNIELPAEWMRNARYPVTLDPDFGYTSMGASIQYFGTGYLYASYETAPADGTITQMSSAWVSYAAGNVQVGIYSDSGADDPNTLLANSGSVAISGSTATWYNNAISQAITNGTKYWFAAMESVGLNNNGLRCDNSGWSHDRIDAVTFGSWPSPFGSPIVEGAYRFSIYATYTAGGATLDQEGFRFRYDNGDEDEAIWAEAQDANMAAPKNVNKRLRFLINATGDPTAKQFQLEYKKSTEGTYKKVT